MKLFKKRLDKKTKNDETDDNFFLSDESPEKQAVTTQAEKAAEDEKWLDEDYEEGQLSVDVFQTKDAIVIKSTIAGVKPEDIDIAIISDREKFKIKGFHISVISINDFFKPVGLINTLLREGYSLIRNKSFSEVYGFNNQCLFKYDLSDLPASKKVQVVNFLRGRKDEKGLGSY